MAAGKNTLVEGVPTAAALFVVEREPERVTPEGLAASLLFFRECGCTSERRLAELEELPLALVGTLLCRALSTLVARGYKKEWVCATLTLKPEQLARASLAPPFGPEFQPNSLLWPPEARERHPAPRPRQEAPATSGETGTIDEAALIAELAALLQEQPAERRPRDAAAVGAGA